MELKQLIKETEKLGIVVLLTDLPESKGRHEEYQGHKIIFLDKNLDEIEAINVLLHERAHFLNNDRNNSLAYIESYSHRIEAQAEKDRIIDFINLVNTEYPIDESFNYIHYMKAACIPDQYERFVREIAHKYYLQNKKEKD